MSKLEDNVNDILGTSFNTIKQVYEGASEQIPTASNFSTGTVYRYWFHDFNSLYANLFF